MRAWAERLGALGTIHTFDYPYVAQGRKAPDRLPRLVEAHTAEIDAFGPDVLLGKSMGSRVGCHAALERDVRAIVCFGYPLRAPSGRLRDEVLLALRTPVLFVQGTKDALCPLDALAAVRSRMAAPSALHVVDGGDHSLIVGRRAGGQAEVDAAILDAVARFVAEPATRRTAAVRSPR
jgi:hypothetical protein